MLLGQWPVPRQLRGGRAVLLPYVADGHLGLDRQVASDSFPQPGRTGIEGGPGLADAELSGRGLGDGRRVGTAPREGAATDKSTQRQDKQGAPAGNASRHQSIAASMSSAICSGLVAEP